MDGEATWVIGGRDTAASMWWTACSTSAACVDEWYGVSCTHTHTYTHTHTNTHKHTQTHTYTHKHTHTHTYTPEKDFLTRGGGLVA